MNRAGVVAALMVLASAAKAQSIRGTVVDEATRAPVPNVLVTMIGDGDIAVGGGVRSDSMGAFVVHAPRGGTWRVRTARIGYAPATSPPVQLAIGQLAVVRLRLTTIAQALAPVQVVERRQYNAGELMSTTGFDLRRERGQGAFLNAERLEAMGIDGLREVLALHLQPRLLVYIDPVVGEVLRMREGARLCAPEIFLDGRLLATAPEPGIVIDTGVPQNALDSAMAQLRQDSEYSRNSFQQVVALNTLAGLTAQAVHGIEVYRANEVPPASLGAWFGMTKASVKTCGTVAVWTKAGAMSVVSTVKPNSAPVRPVQVISGILVDYETGKPVGGKQVYLLDEGLDEIGNPARTNEQGEFVLRTGRSGAVRLRSGDTAYRISTSPIIKIATNELTIVKLFVSSKEPLNAPLAIASRVFPHSIGMNSRAGFTYRRERAQGGEFLRGEDIARTSHRSLLDALRGVEDVDVPTTSAEQILVRGQRTPCKPSFFLDGQPSGPTVATTVPIDRLLGVEVYTRPALLPPAFSDGQACAVIAVWTKG
jgi:hypothetical protein